MAGALTVSTIIPTRNRPELLRLALDSVLRQTVLPQEIIVVDDASTVPCAEVLARFAGAAPPVRYHRHAEAKGGSAARNSGAELATGDILMFLDDDDTWLPEKVARQVAIFEAQPEVGLVYAGRRAVNQHGELLYEVRPRVSGQAHRTLLVRNVVGVTSSVALRGEVFRAAGGFDPGMPARQDYDLWVRVAKVAPIAYDPEPTINYLVRDEAGMPIGPRPEVYERAGELIFAKYAGEYAALSALERRQAWAWHYVTVAEKYARRGSALAYGYALRSLLQFPSLAALSRLLPRALWVRLRGRLRRQSR